VAEAVRPVYRDLTVDGMPAAARLAFAPGGFAPERLFGQRV
jgi:hypothetical protein